MRLLEILAAYRSGDVSARLPPDLSGLAPEAVVLINEILAMDPEQDWLKSNLARLMRTLHGQRDLQGLAKELLRELVTLLPLHAGVIYLRRGASKENNGETTFSLAAGHGISREHPPPASIRLGEGMVGQCAATGRISMLSEVRASHLRFSSGLVQAMEVDVSLLPVVYEQETLAVLELASPGRISRLHRTFLEQLTDSLGFLLHSVLATARLEKKNLELTLAWTALEEKARQLEMTTRYKGQFLANMSHELRTPLNSLMILSRMLSENRDGNLTPRQVEWADTVHQGGADLLALINEVLDLSKIEAGKLQVNPDMVPLEQVREGVDSMFRQVAEERCLSLEVTLTAGTPEQIFIDEKRLHQVLRNLLSNAFKFTEDGGVSLEIRPARLDEMPHSQEGGDRWIAFEVTDSGIGIPMDKQALIFEAFQQVEEGNARRYGGTGLGLAISRDLAKLMDGDLQVQSEEGRGSVFTLFLPLGVLMDEPLDELETSPDSEVLQEEFKDECSWDSSTTPTDVEGIALDGAADRIMLLIGHDSRVNAVLEQAALVGGFRVALARTGKEGVAAAKKLLPDAVCLDLSLPRLEGWTTLDHFKHKGELRHVPILAVAQASERSAALEQGVAVCLTVADAQNRDVLTPAVARLKGLREGRQRRLLVATPEVCSEVSILGLLPEAMVSCTHVSSEAELRSALAQDWADGVVVDSILMGGRGLSPGDLARETAKACPGGAIRTLIYSEDERGLDIATVPARDGASLSRVCSQEELVAGVVSALHLVEARLPAPARRLLKRGRQGDGVLAGRRFLIIEDDMRNIFALTSVLEAHGVEVLYRQDAREGLELLSGDGGIDLVLMDVMMPGMDGLTATRKIRQELGHATLPIIALTAKAMEGDRERCLEAGCSDYMSKPVQVNRLISLLRVWLRRAGSG